MTQNLHFGSNTDQDLMRLLEMQELLIGIASKYINIPLDQVNAAINQSLREMGEFVNADRAYIFEYDLSSNTARNTYEWCAHGIEPQIENLQELPLDNVQIWVEAHQRNDPFEVPDVQALSDDGPGGLRDILEPQGIKSLITVPMGIVGEFFGTVGFDAVREKYVFTNREKTLLRLFANMLVNIQLRKRTDSEKASYLAKIKLQNEKMKEYAFVVSHKIRSHSSNFEGLLNIMDSESRYSERDESFRMLQQASKDLDETLREITRVISR